MKTQHYFKLLFAASILITAAISCTNNDPTSPGNENATEIEELIKAAGEIPDPVTHPLQEDTLSVAEYLKGDEVWQISEIKISAAEAPDKFPCFDPGAEVIWPGAALQGKTIQSPIPERIIAKRSKGTVLINNVSGATVSSVSVDEVTQANVMNAANEIIRNQPQSFPADLYISINRIRCQEELALKLGANAGFFSLFSANSSFKLSQKDEVTSFLVRLTQSFYTLIFERPPKISDFFHDDVTVEDLKPFIGYNNAPVYISSVTYGRVFYLLIEAVEKADTMETSLSASFIFGGVSGEVKHVSQLSGLNVQVFALGGEQSEVFNAVIGGTQSLDTFLEKLRNGSVITTGKPLSYSVRSVGSDKLVKNAVATEYTVKDGKLVSKGVPKPILWYIADKDHVKIEQRNWRDQGMVDCVVQWYDCSETKNSATFNEGSYKFPPAYVPNFINGRGALKSRSQHAWLALALNEMQYLNFYGGDLVNSDYTIFVLLNFEGGDGSQDMYNNVINGSVDSPYKRLRLGFKGVDRLHMDHNGAELTAQLPSNIIGKNIICTFRFSRSEGMSMFINGNFLAEDRSQTNALVEFPGAMIGLTHYKIQGAPNIYTYEVKLNIIQFIAYNQTLKDNQRKTIEDFLKREYNL